MSSDGSDPVEREVRINFEKAHGVWPDHVDMVQPFDQGLSQEVFYGAHKIRVGADSKILSDELV
ncbi:MAG TPA: hypothetical protein DEF00_01770 [Candidatus Taylorbacteria bacterium]|nr:MAG: hypothetical protein UY03_C0037G0002 [Parcubacteria group bacterium GW2011_GWA2_47_64]KKU96422.1 MAG: hypothetical protein UY29_C0012G0026 [Parcubacteria group bacterium GW2011_GWC2_48_17]HBV01105.1 hypothetical protein [Candidatus Taylorbacteria bacterium]